MIFACSLAGVTEVTMDVLTRRMGLGCFRHACVLGVGVYARAYMMWLCVAMQLEALPHVSNFGALQSDTAMGPIDCFLSVHELSLVLLRPIRRRMTISFSTLIGMA
jgi:hypothetical protein